MLTLQFEDRIEYTFWARADSDINDSLIGSKLISRESLPQRTKVRGIHEDGRKFYNQLLFTKIKYCLRRS